MDIQGEENKWKSKTTLHILLFLQYINIMNVTIVPNTAILQGVTGYTLLLIASFIVLGIPIAYMESIVGQFTERDCIDVWKIRPCLSHIGYVLLAWQFLLLMCNHILTSMSLHYFLLSFQNPIPYITCGPWSDSSCNIMKFNFTVNQECAQKNDAPYFCDEMYKTFPEYQHWKYNIMNVNTEPGYRVIWRLCLDSTIVILVIYFICFKQEMSLKYSMPLLCVVPLVGLLILFLGSMRQKGVVEKFESGLDLNFEVFPKQVNVEQMIQQVILNFRIGTGLTFNLASNSSFRTACFSNCVICVFLSAIFTTVCIITFTMMSCPYAFQYNETIRQIFLTRIRFPYERLPRILSMTHHEQFYLIFTYGILSILGIGTGVLVYFNLFDMLLKRSPKFRRYPGLTCFIGCVILFLVTLPLLSNYGLSLAVMFRLHLSLIPTIIALLESIVFVLWYGISRFSEDVHFMLGIQPNMWLKMAWVMANVILIVVIFKDLLGEFHNTTFRMNNYSGYIYVFLILIISIGVLVQIIIASFHKQFWEIFVLDPQWGPKNEVLQRSRGMFSAQAMTKEYMYRQYHLQAGILARQKASNIRV